MDIAGQRVVVIGGTSGIGLATARAAAERGARVVIVSSREASVEEALAQLPEGASGHAVDVRDSGALDALFERLGTLDHLVFTPGEALVFKPLAQIDDETAHDFLQIRYFGALAAARAAAPRLPASGSITLSSGMAVQRPGPGFALLSSVFGAVEGLTRALAIDLAPVRVNTVRPGLVRSPLWSSLSEEDRSGMYESTAKSLLVGHVGEPEELALAYIYLMTQTYATGTILPVEGGLALV
jgi:NAD(P)-dependent dehydrogenase (short-subunit alcohol dehydrogenase family)